MAEVNDINQDRCRQCTAGLDLQKLSILSGLSVNIEAKMFGDNVFLRKNFMTFHSHPSCFEQFQKMRHFLSLAACPGCSRSTATPGVKSIAKIQVLEKDMTDLFDDGRCQWNLFVPP